MTGRTAALPRSLLHLQFLIDNAAEPDIVLVRDRAMTQPVERAYPGRMLWLDREITPGRSPASLLAARRANRAYYDHVARVVADAGIARLILFLEGEPLERFLMDLPGDRVVELWEDGLSHYVDLTSDAWYAARGLIQRIAGFYPHHITKRRIDRGTVLVRDRFERKNLSLRSPPEPSRFRDELLLIGSPLVEDRIVPRRRFLDAVRSIARASERNVRYLPHPREDKVRLAGDLASIGEVLLEPNPDGLMRHAADYGYAAYVAAVSTGLLDLGRWERSLFVPGLFGLDRMARVLRGWRFNPVTVAIDAGDLATRLRTIRPAPAALATPEA